MCLLGLEFYLHFNLDCKVLHSMDLRVVSMHLVNPLAFGEELVLLPRGNVCKLS